MMGKKYYNKSQNKNPIISDQLSLKSQKVISLGVGGNEGNEHKIEIDKDIEAIQFWVLGDNETLEFSISDKSTGLNYDATNTEADFEDFNRLTDGFTFFHFLSFIVGLKFQIDENTDDSYVEIHLNLFERAKGRL